MIATNVWKKRTCTHTVVGVEYTYKNKNKNFLLPIKGPQGANNLIQWLKWLKTYM